MRVPDASPLLAAFARLDAASARAAATYYQAVAAALEEHAARLDRKDRQGRAFEDRRRQCEREAPGLVGELRAQGYPHHDACERASRTLRVPVETVAYYVELAGRRARRAERAARDRMMVTLARRGWSNRAIGEHVGLSASQAGRVVRRALSERPPPPLRRRSDGHE